jgi:hypothetical protein
MTFVVCRTSLPDMLPALYLGRTLGVDHVRYYLMHEYSGMDWKTVGADGREFAYRDECVSLFPDEYARVRAEVARAADLLGFEVELPAVPIALPVAARAQGQP